MTFCLVDSIDIQSHFLSSYSRRRAAQEACVDHRAESGHSSGDSNYREPPVVDSQRTGSGGSQRTGSGGTQRGGSGGRRSAKRESSGSRSKEEGSKGKEGRKTGSAGSSKPISGGRRGDVEKPSKAFKD